MSVENLHTLSLAFLIAAGVLFLAAVILFFVFHIPKLIDEMTGAAKKRDIAAILERNERGETGEVKGRSVYSASGQLTAPKEPSADAPQAQSPGTVKLETVKLPLSQAASGAGSADAGNDGQKLPVLSPGTAFSIIEELSFTGSTEVIE